MGIEGRVVLGCRNNPHIPTIFFPISGGLNQVVPTSQKIGNILSGTQ